MAEQLSHGQEHFKAKAEAGHETQHRKKGPEHHKHHEKAEQAPVATLEKQAKAEAVAGKELFGKETSRPSESTVYVNRELKQQTWNRSIARVRKHLSVPSRAFSKVIHQPVVAAVSETAGKTIARPSGLFLGSLCAFLGSTFILYMSKHYGFRYNYMLFAVFFVGGFVVGLAVEGIMNVLQKRRA